MLIRTRFLFKYYFFPKIPQNLVENFTVRFNTSQRRQFFRIMKPNLTPLLQSFTFNNFNQFPSDQRFRVSVDTIF